MTAEFSITLAALSVLLLVARLALPQLPIAGAAKRLSVADLVILGVGALGLAFHCTAMFYRPLFDGIPSIAPLVSTVNSLGIASIVLYTIPAVLVLVGLRRQHPLTLIAMGIVLLAVGITMYVRTLGSWHLTTIFVTVVLLAGVVTLLTISPWHKSSKTSATAV